MAEEAYRKPAAVRDDTPDRLECWLRDGERGRWVRAIWIKAWVTMIVCGFIAASEARLAAVPAALIGILWASSDYRNRKGANVTFRVRNGRVAIKRPLGNLDVALDELADVRLDTRARSKNVTMARADGVNSVFGAASTHNIDIDQSRIELLFDDGESAVLDREFISHSLCSEELRSIRLFLRAHGWKPRDERSAHRLDEPAAPDRDLDNARALDPKAS